MNITLREQPNGWPSSGQPPCQDGKSRTHGSTFVNVNGLLWNMTGWWFGTWILWLSIIILGMSSSQLTNSIIFQRGRLNHQPVILKQDCNQRRRGQATAESLAASGSQGLPRNGMVATARPGHTLGSVSKSWYDLGIWVILKCYSSLQGHHSPISHDQFLLGLIYH